MPGATPTQGFAYPIPADNPASLASTWATLAGQVDAKGAVYDADSARVIANNFVKISASNASDQINNPAFSTVEVNRGTSTDLSAYNGLLIGSGLWLVGGSLLATAHGGGGAINASPVVQPYPVPAAGTVAIPAASPIVPTIRDAGGEPTGGLVDGLTTGFAFMQPFYLQSSLYSVSMNATTFVGRTFVYVDLWAFKVGDL